MTGITSTLLEGRWDLTTTRYRSILEPLSKTRSSGSAARCPQITTRFKSSPESIDLSPLYLGEVRSITQICRVAAALSRGSLGKSRLELFHTFEVEFMSFEGSDETAGSLPITCGKGYSCCHIPAPELGHRW